jgi:hypothetical protein
MVPQPMTRTRDPVGGRAPDGMDGDGCWLGEDGLLIAELGWDGD